MGDVLDFNNLNKKINCETNVRFCQKELSVIRNNATFNYAFIVLEYKETLEIEDTVFSGFYFSKGMNNNGINTKKQDYGRVIVQFLNFIFFDMENKLNSIENLTVEQGNKFLLDYSIGLIGGKEIKREVTVQKAENVLTRFYYWLCYSMDFKMKFVKRNIFNTIQTKYFNHNIQKFEVSKRLESIFTVYYHKKKPRRKLKKMNEYLVIQLIEVAIQYDPMIAFAIALQAFAGLRRGEVCQMTFGRVIEHQPEGTILACDLDLQENLMLRDDGVRSGEIKKLRIQPIYEAFMPYYDKLFKAHKLFIQQKGFDRNKYGAMFLAGNGKAMTTDRYDERFSLLIPKLQDRLQKLADLGSTSAQENSELLQLAKLTPHSLRYFFSQYVAEREGHNPYIVAVYRGDSNIDSALRYLKNSRSNIKHIHEIQDGFAKEYAETTGYQI